MSAVSVVSQPDRIPVGVRFRRRRTVAALLVAGTLGSGIVAANALTGPGGIPASAAGTGTVRVPRAVRARAGDSLWSIAEVFHGDIAIARFVEALISLNGGTRIDDGQIVRLP